MVESSKESASKMTASLYAYDGLGSPKWVDEAVKDGEFVDTSVRCLRVSYCCTYLGQLRKLLCIKSDLSKIVKENQGKEGKSYWTCSYDIVMKFGGPELSIFAAWKEGVRVLVIFSNRCVNFTAPFCEQDIEKRCVLRWNYATLHLQTH